MRVCIGLTLAALSGFVLGNLADVRGQQSPEQVAPPRDARAAAQDVGIDSNDDVEVQTRGPIHEAFAQPVARDPEQTPLVRKKPPQPVPELPPDVKPEGEASTWIPGYWAFDDEREDYLWVSGTWRVAPPGRNWMPGYWDEANGGWRWVAGYWTEPEAQAEVYPEPPERIQEAIPPQTQEDATYVGGNWVYRTNTYLWRPGYYVPHRPGWVWISPCYSWTPAGYVFVDGYWDRDFHHRGLCFAPVYFRAGYLGRAGYAYRPSFAVRADFLLGSLFFNTSRRHYYYGDYFEPRYARQGFNFWIGTGRYYDPNFAYYRWQNRNQPAWERDVVARYEDRRDGRAPRPPRTFAEQQRLVANQTVKNRNDVQVTVNVNQVQKNSNDLKLTSVSKAELQQARQTADQINKSRLSRTQIEGKARTEGGPKAGGAAVKLALPQVQIARKASAQNDAPPPPPIPKAVAQSPETTKPRPKGKDVDGKPTPRAKDDDGKPTPPRGKDDDDKPRPPKGKDFDDKKPTRPKGKDFDDKPMPPKGKDIDNDPRPPRNKEVNPKPNPPKGKDTDVPRVPKQRDDDDVRPSNPPRVNPPARRRRSNRRRFVRRGKHLGLRRCGPIRRASPDRRRVRKERAKARGEATTTTNVLHMRLNRPSDRRRRPWRSGAALRR